MTPQEIQRLIDLAFSQWPKLEPNPAAVIGWTRHLAGYDFDEAANAVVDTWATATMPPSVADVLAILTGEADELGWQEAWAIVAELMRRGRFREALLPDEFPNLRVFEAARSIQFDARNATADKARWMFRDAYAAAGQGRVRDCDLELLTGDELHQAMIEQ